MRREKPIPTEDGDVYLELHGRLTGGAVREQGRYRAIIDDMVVTVDGDVVSVTLVGAPDDSDVTEAALGSRFDALLLAQTMRTGISSTVHWTGMTTHDQGRNRTRAQVTVRGPWSAFRHSARLGHYAVLADAISRDGVVREASQHVRAATVLFQETESITSLGETYLAVATLVVDHSGDEARSDWRAFGYDFSRVGQPFDGDNLEQLYASCQWGRHHLQDIASGTLRRLVRPQLNEYECLKLAAELVAAFAIARGNGQM